MDYTRFLITFPVPRPTPDFNLKEWIEEILAFVYKLYGCEPKSCYNMKDLTLTVWFEYDKQEDIKECLIKK